MALYSYALKASSQDVFRAIGEHDLSLTQLKGLHGLAAQRLDGGPDGGLTVKELAELLGVSLPAASRALDCLFRRGFVERREDEADRRMKRATITPGGRAVIERMEDARLAVLEELFASLSDAERRRLAVALAPLTAREEIAACRPKRSRR